MSWEIMLERVELDRVPLIIMGGDEVRQLAPPDGQVNAKCRLDLWAGDGLHQEPPEGWRLATWQEMSNFILSGGSRDLPSDRLVSTKLSLARLDHGLWKYDQSRSSLPVSIAAGQGQAVMRYQGWLDQQVWLISRLGLNLCGDQIARQKVAWEAELEAEKAAKAYLPTVYCDKKAHLDAVIGIVTL